MAKPKTKKYITPIGTAGYSWLNKPDEKYNVDGTYTAKLILEGTDAEQLKTQVDGFVDEAWDEQTEDMTVGKKKKYSKAYPYAAEEDDDGEETGRTIFNFKQNAKIKTKKDGVIEIKVPLYNRFGKPSTKSIFPGSKIEIEFSTRSYAMSSTENIGTTLHLCAVLVRDYAEGGGGADAEGRGFSVDEGSDDTDDDSGEGFTPDTDDTSSDDADF